MSQDDRLVLDLAPGCTIIRCDCRNIVAELRGIDAVITDPPYQTTDLSLDTRESIDWKIFTKCVQSNGYLIVFGPINIQSAIFPIWKRRFSGVWVKNNPVMKTHSAKKPMGQFEPYEVYAHPDSLIGDLTWNQVFLEGTPYKKVHRNTGYKRGGKDMLDRQGTQGWTKDGFVSENDGFRYCTDVLVGNNKSCMKHIDRTEHPTQKPINVMEILVQWTTNPGDLVLDPFMGSGTTGVACIRTDRRFIGIEIDHDYFDMARRRLERELSQYRLGFTKISNERRESD